MKTVNCCAAVENMDKKKVECLPSDHTTKRNILRKFQKLCREVIMNFDTCLQDCNIREKVDSVTKYLTSRPLLLICVIAVTSAIFIPILIFTVFAVTSVAFTFSGFIIIEGTLLAFGALVLTGVLLSVITTMIMLGTCMITSYYVCSQLCIFLKKLQK